MIKMFIIFVIEHVKRKNENPSVNMHALSYLLMKKRSGRKKRDEETENKTRKAMIWARL